jgi:tetratricopeptide (TPR) repeat protein
MHEALISQLSQLDFLRVLSRTSASQYDKTGKTVPQIGADLGVDALIEGSVLRADGRVRITVQVIEVASDRHLWAESYERDLVDIIALQREVAEAIVEELRGELAPDATVDAQLTEAPPQAPTDPEATDAVMMGRMALADLAGGALFTASGLDSVARHFQRAIDRDPTFAAAHSGLAQVYLMRTLASGGVPSAEGILAAKESATQALVLDPNSRESKEVLAHVELLGSSALPEGAGGPFVPEVRLGADSIGVVIVGNEEKPMVSVTEPGRQIQIAWARREAESESPGTQMRAARRFASIGMPDEAREVLLHVVQMDPRNFQAWDELEQMHRVLGDLDEVVALWRTRTAGAGRGRAAPSAPGDPSAASIEELERAVARDSSAGYWRWRLQELQGRQGRGLPASPVELAAAHAGVGDGDRALSFLEQGVRAGDPRARSIRTDPVWDPYRRDLRFTRALAQAQGWGPPPRIGRGGDTGRDGGRGGSGGAPDAAGRGGVRPQGRSR